MAKVPAAWRLSSAGDVRFVESGSHHPRRDCEEGGIGLGQTLRCYCCGELRLLCSRKSSGGWKWLSLRRHRARISPWAALISEIRAPCSPPPTVKAFLVWVRDWSGGSEEARILSLRSVFVFRKYENDTVAKANDEQWHHQIIVIRQFGLVHVNVNIQHIRHLNFSFDFS